MRRFFSRSVRGRSASPEQLALSLEGNDHQSRVDALAQACELRAEQLSNERLQQALEAAAGEWKDASLLSRLLPLLANGETLTRLISNSERHAQAWLQARPDPTHWPATLRSQPKLRLLMLRQKLQHAATGDEARDLLDSAEVSELPFDTRLALWLSRKDVVSGLWSLPEAAALEGLQQIERSSRGKNKSVNREARRRLDALKTSEREAASQQQRKAEIEEAAVRLQHQVELQGYRSDRDLAAHALLTDEWTSLGETATTLPTLNETLPTETELRHAEAEKKRAEFEAEQASRDPQPLTTASAGEEPASNADADANADGDADETETSTVEIADNADAPDAQEASETTDERATSQDTIVDAETEAELGRRLVAFEEVLTTLETAIDAGSTRTAGQNLQQLRKLDDPPLRLPRALRRRFGIAQATMREWNSWQTFATSPKRAELVTAMQQAAEAPLEPEPQAERIKELRAAWRELGPPRGSAEREQATAFDAAAEKAFEPCRSFFAEKAEQREANARAREELCAMLERYLAETDWATADFAAAERILKQARTDWRALHPVPRKGEGALRDRFEGLQEQLYDRLKQHRQKHRAVKEGLVQQAAALAASEAPLEERIQAAKGLQHQWQQAGRLPRKEDQTLWKAFRESLDQLFTTRDEEHKASEQARGEQLQAIDKALDALSESQAEPTPTALQACLEAVDELIAGLPERDARTQQRRLDDAEKRYRAALREARAAERLARIQQWLDWDEMAATDPESLPEDAPTELRLPGEASTETLRGFVLRCEMSADVESPASDREERMQLKLAALQTGRGKTETQEHRSAEELAQAWCAFGRKESDEASALRSRLRKALDALG